VAALTGVAGPAAAQTDPPVIRGDVAASVGWLAVNTAPSTPYDDTDWADSFLGAVSAGWHWTDNLKTELDLGASTDVTAYRTDPVTIGGRPTYQTTRTTSSRRTVGLAQQYQFFHNVWFHPHVGAGATVSWERTVSHGNPIFIYDVDRGAQFGASSTAERTRTTVAVRPFVASGFKAYMSDRVFFRSDIRVAFRGGPDDVLMRVGIGVDF
jgi:outer membrane protein W